jgi:hypothetical protein
MNPNFFSDPDLTSSLMSATDPDSDPDQDSAPDSGYWLNMHFFNLTLPLFWLKKFLFYQRNSFLKKWIHKKIQQLNKGLNNL